MLTQQPPWAVDTLLHYYVFVTYYYIIITSLALLHHYYDVHNGENDEQYVIIGYNG